MVSISLVMAVIVTNIYLRKDSHNPVPVWLRRTLLRGRTLRHACASEVRRRRVFARGGGSENARENHVNDAKAGRSSFRERTDIELDNVSAAQSELESLAPACGGNGGGGGNGVMVRRCTTRRSAVYNRPTSADIDRGGGSLEVAQEWDDLAQMVDRIFFWIFFVASVAALLNIFAPIPNIS